MTAAAPLFSECGGGWVPAPHCRGPWDPGAMHGGAPAALLARALERHEPEADVFVGRLTLDILGPVPLVPLVLDGPHVVKPGTRFQVLEASLSAEGRAVVVARAVRLRRDPDGRAAGAPAPAMAPVAGEPWRTSFPGIGEEAFHPTAMDVRIAGGARGSGAAQAWSELRCPVVAGEEPTGLQRAAAAADFGNGVSAALPFDEFLFVNCDLGLHLFRDPRGTWIGLDARSDVGPHGVGQSTSVLHDEGGAFGMATQTLFVAPR